LLRSSADTDILGEVHPAHRAGGVHEEFGRPCNVFAALPRSRMQQIIATNNLCARVGQKREGVTGVLAECGGLFRRVDTDRNRTNSLRLERREIVFDTP
jgi:hypothetical protein